MLHSLTPHDVHIKKSYHGTSCQSTTRRQKTVTKILQGKLEDSGSAVIAPKI